MLKDCGLDTRCGENGCLKPHHPLLHREGNDKAHTEPSGHSAVVQESSSEEPKEQRGGEAKNVSVHAQNSCCTFQIVPVFLSNGFDREVKTYAFLDNGSEVTLIDEKLAKELSLHGPKANLHLKWSNDSTRMEKSSMFVSPIVYNIKKDEGFTLKNARTVKNLSLPIQSVSPQIMKSYPHLQVVPIEEYCDARPRILIGLDNYQLLVAQETVEGKWDEPVATRTRIGWTVYGSASDDKLVRQSHVHQISETSLADLVEKFFSLENIGICKPAKLIESIADSRARELMDRYVRQREDGRYVTRLLWKSENVVLPDSKPMAIARFRQFERKMTKEGTREIMNKAVQEYIDADFLTSLSHVERENKTFKTWYLPIFSVTNPNKVGKIRLVWDAAATVQGKSLNDFLYTGPDMMANLIGILFKFRERRVAVGGDIEKMFHQVLIEEEDQDAQRCLWRRSPEDPIDEFKMKVMTFGAACSPSLAQYVKNRNARRFSEQYPRAVNAIIDRHYVDDYLDSFDCETEAAEVVKQVVHIHVSADFNLRELISNYNSILSIHPVP